jgi:hypothetical protein
MDMVEVLREQIKQLRAAQTEAEKQRLLEELKQFLISISPEQRTDHLQAIGTLVSEMKNQLDAERSVKRAA